MARRFALGALCIVAAATVATAISYSPSRAADPLKPDGLQMRLSSSEITPGRWVSIDIEDPDASVVALATYAVFQERRRGRWESTWFLPTRLKVRAGVDPTIRITRNTGYPSDALAPGTPDSVRIPPVRPGRYRIQKEIVVADGSENVGLRLHRPVRVLGE